MYIYLLPAMRGMCIYIYRSYNFILYVFKYKYIYLSCQERRFYYKLGCTPETHHVHWLTVTFWTAIYLFRYSFLGAGDVWFSLRSTTYQNNSIVTLEDIGESEDALHCITNLTSCCRSGDASSGAKGNWYFPNGTKVPGSTVDWNIFRSRGQRVVHLSRRRGGVDGVYHCEIPDTMNITQNVYIGVYTGSSGE